MKALILAAGFGKRLQPITNEIPKAMVEVNGIPLLVNTLNILSNIGISEIGIVIGYKADYIIEKIGYQFKGIPIQYFENKIFKKTNNVYSLYCARDFCTDEMILLECDLFYKKELIDKIVKEPNSDCSILVSNFNPKTMDGTVIECDDGIAKNLVLGKWQRDNFDYSKSLKTVNIYKFSTDFIKKFINLIKWYCENMGTNCYYEKLLGAMIYLREDDFHIVKVSDALWCEIDNEQDLEKANEKFKP